MGGVVGAVAGAVTGGGIGGALIGAGASLIGSSMSASAAKKAAAQQTQAANQANELQRQIFETQNAQLAPQRAAGYNALNTIGSLMPGQYTQYDAEGNPIGTQTGTGYLTRQFTAQDLNANLAPNYAWQLGQGQAALGNQLNVAGGLVGGNTLKAMQDYTQNFAGNAYQQAFSNYQAQRGNIYNTLASIAGIGQSAQNASNTLATNYGTNTANLATGAAAAQAAGTVGAANAYSQGLGGAANQYQLYNFLNPSQQQATPVGGYAAATSPYVPGYSSLANAPYPNFDFRPA